MSQVFWPMSKSSLKSLCSSPSQVSSLWGPITSHVSSLLTRVQVKSQVFVYESKSSLKSLRTNNKSCLKSLDPSQVSSLWGPITSHVLSLLTQVQVKSQVFVFESKSSLKSLRTNNKSCLKSFDPSPSQVSSFYVRVQVNSQVFEDQ